MRVVSLSLALYAAAVSAGQAPTATYVLTQSLQSPATVPIGASARSTWSLCSDAPLRPLFVSGAVLQTFVNREALGAALEPWSFAASGLCAYGEYTIPLSFPTTVSIDLAMLAAPLPNPGFNLPYPQTVLAAANQSVKVTASGFPSSTFTSSLKERSAADDGTVVGMFWEPWFTPLNFGKWPWAEALPALSTYLSSQPTIARQHGLWMASTGMEAVGIDWTNNLWSCNTFDCRHPNVRELMNDTQLAFGVWQGLRGQGFPVPQALLLMGLDNGPVASMQAIEQQLQWTQTAILENSTAGGADAMLHDPVTDQPLVVLFDGTLKNHTSMSSIGQWGVRWMGSQLQGRPSAAEELGYWSWMDGVENAVITPLPPSQRSPDNEQGSVTIACAFFGGNGWLGSTSLGKRGGATLIESFLGVNARVGRNGNGSMNIRFLWVNQWNEFAGQANGGGYGPNKDDFVDIYSSELGNDMEPTDLRSCGYKRPGVACGGYGWRQMNLLRFFSAWTKDLSVASNETILAVEYPPVGFALNGSATLTLSVIWAQFNTSGAPLVPGIGTDGPPVSIITVHDVNQQTGEAHKLAMHAPRDSTLGNTTGTVITVTAPAVCGSDSSAMALISVCVDGYTTSQALRLREDDASYGTTQTKIPVCVEHAVACSIV